MSVEERNDKTDEIGNCVGGLHAQQRDRCESELKDKSTILDFCASLATNKRGHIPNAFPVQQSIKVPQTSFRANYI